MKRIILDHAVEEKFQPSKKPDNLKELRSKVAHNHPLDPAEISKVRELLGNNPRTEEIVRKLDSQRLTGANWVLRKEEREQVDTAILQVMEMTREKAGNAVATC